MPEVVGVEAGQWRRLPMIAGTIVVEILEPSPTRPGFWHVIGPHVFDRVEAYGRREIERWELVARDWFGGRPHPGAERTRNYRSMKITPD